MNEQEKYTKLWALPQGYGNNWSADNAYWSEIAEFIVTAMHERGFNVSDNVLDVGGGNGKFEPWLGLEGGSYTSLDIAPNSGADIIADISTYHGWGPFGGLHEWDWTVAIDMLEHLPTDRVYDALANIRKMTDKGAVFLISTRPDRGGKKIGATLHMTVRQPVWWIQTLEDHWDKVEVLRTVKGKQQYCILVCQ